jgi:hypothetical protein
MPFSAVARALPPLASRAPGRFSACAAGRFSGARPSTARSLLRRHIPTGTRKNTSLAHIKSQDLVSQHARSRKIWCHIKSQDLVSQHARSRKIWRHIKSQDLVSQHARSRKIWCHIKSQDLVFWLDGPHMKTFVPMPALLLHQQRPAGQQQARFLLRWPRPRESQASCCRPRRRQRGRQRRPSVRGEPSHAQKGPRRTAQ